GHLAGVETVPEQAERAGAERRVEVVVAPSDDPGYRLDQSEVGTGVELAVEVAGQLERVEHPDRCEAGRALEGRPQRLRRDVVARARPGREDQDPSGSRSRRRGRGRGD